MGLNILEVYKFIDEKLENYEDVTLKKCCEHFNYSYFYFSRLFKRIVGIPPTDYISALKMEKILGLLHDPDFKVEEVYNLIKYQSRSSFNRSFKRYMDVSIRKYKLTAMELNKEIELIINNYKGKTIEFLTKDYNENYIKNGKSLNLEIRLPENLESPIITVGLYSSPIALGGPLRGKVLFNTNSCKFENLPEGKYYIFANIVNGNLDKKDYFVPQNLLRAYSGEILDFLWKNIITLEIIEDEEFYLPVTVNTPKLILDCLKGQTKTII